MDLVHCLGGGCARQSPESGATVTKELCNKHLHWREEGEWLPWTRANLSGAITVRRLQGQERQKVEEGQTASGPFQSCSFSLGGPRGGLRELGKGERRGEEAAPDGGAKCQPPVEMEVGGGERRHLPPHPPVPLPPTQTAGPRIGCLKKQMV